jgi:LysM repeat protein
MKPHTLPIKRRPAPKGVLHKLSAVTGSRKQRVAAAAAAGDMDMEDGSSRIARALTIIFLIHIVALGLIFFHRHFLEGRGVDTAWGSSEAQPAPAALTPASTPPAARESLPRLSNGDKVYVVKSGDNYERIAEREGVEVAALREANQQVEIRPGLILSVPPRRIVAEEPAELARMRGNPSVAAEAAVPAADHGLVPAIDVNDAPRATPVTAAATPAAAESAPATKGRTHKVKAGDNVWRISQQYKVKQDDLMKLNQITDARKVRIGMELVIPD